MKAIAVLSAWAEDAQSATKGISVTTASGQEGQGAAVGQGAWVGAGGHEGHAVATGHTGAVGHVGHCAAVGQGTATGQGVDFPPQATSNAAVISRNSPLIIRYFDFIAFSSNAIRMDFVQDTIKFA